MVGAEPFRFRDHFHLWIWREPIRMDAGGFVAWKCKVCGCTTRRKVGDMPAALED